MRLMGEEGMRIYYIPQFVVGKYKLEPVGILVKKIKIYPDNSVLIANKTKKGYSAHVIM
jgi:hypothetical protein